MSWSKHLAAPTTRTSAFFFVFMMPSAVANLGLSLWLAALGMNQERIGVINAAPLVAVVALGLFVGRLADRWANWRGVILICCGITALTPLLLVATRADWDVAMVWTLVMLPFYAMGPVADAAAIRVATQAGGAYGAIRVWGSLGYVIVGVFIPLMLATSAVRLAVGFWLPNFQARHPAGGRTAPKRPFAVSPFRDLKQLMRPWFIAPVLGSALLMGSHIPQNGFGPLIWRSEGVPDWLIGVYLAIAPAAEITAMLLSHRLLAVFPARVVLVGCCLVGVVRWCGYVVPLGPVAVGLLQTLHLVTYALGYVAIIVFADAWSDASIGAQVQSFATLVRNIVAILGFLALGALTARIGAYVYFAAAGMCVLGALLCAWSLVIMPARKLT
jgi:PPP family 3-phenylpropionic acid transporter